MEEKKVTGSYNRKKTIIRSIFSQWRRKRRLGVTIEKVNKNTNFITIKKKKGTGSCNRKRLS